VLSSVHRIVNRSALAAALLLIVLALCPARPASSDENLVHNGDLSAGSGDLPDDWRPTSLRKRTVSVFSWQRASADPGELRLTSSEPNVADWSQTLALSPGWYYLSGEMRMPGIAVSYSGATIGIQVTAHTFSVSWLGAGTTADWRKGGLYFKVGGSGRNVQVICRLEGTGAALFRLIRLARVPDAPAIAARVDLDSVQDQPEIVSSSVKPRPFAPPRGRGWTIVATILLLSGIAIWGWTALGPDPHEAHSNDQGS
jgi:hypothetical protein